MRFDRFFSNWALLAHVAFALGYFYNTFLLAVLVLIGATIINITINEQYSFKYDVIAHYLPLILFFNNPMVLDIRPVIILTILYLAYMKFDICTLVKYYRRQKDYFLDRY